MVKKMVKGVLKCIGVFIAVAAAVLAAGAAFVIIPDMIDGSGADDGRRSDDAERLRDLRP